MTMWKKDPGDDLTARQKPWMGFGESPLSLFDATVMHQRLKPFLHRFSYSVFNILIDLDQLKQAHAISPFFAVNRFAPIAFYEKDHGDGSSNALAQQIRTLLCEKGVVADIVKIHLLCYPRIFGYVFNPISIYFCEDETGLAAMIYEVRNTFGGIHTYVAPLKEGELRASGLRQECEKVFHVSPFLAMAMHYCFRIKQSHNRLHIRILEQDGKGPILAATLSARQYEATTSALLKRLLKKPFVTAKVIAAIHMEALKLWLKGAQYYPNPHRQQTR